MRAGAAGRATLAIAIASLAAGGVAAAVTRLSPMPEQSVVILAAAGLPSWNISEICATDSASGQCRILESEALRTLSGGWNAVPERFRDACLKSISGPFDKSYRLLSQCLETQVLMGPRKEAGTAAAAAPAAQPTAANKVAQVGEPAPAAIPTGYAVLPTTSVADLFKARGTWGQGAPAKKVEAPLAAGAVTPLPAETATLPKGFEGQPTVHPLQATPPAQLTAVPEAQLADAMKKLLAEREGGGAAAASGYAVLPTTTVSDLFAARGAWGQGAPAKAVEAPLAAGAVAPLPAEIVTLPMGFEGTPTVHPLDATPPAQLTPVAADQVAAALKQLFAEREGWLTAAPTAPAAAGAEAATAAANYAVLPTTSVADLVAAREAWGAGEGGKKVDAPLATGTYSPLPVDKIELPKGFEGEPTVHPLEATPPVQLTAVPEAQLGDAMKKLLAERAGWGNEPSSGAGAVGDSSGYAVLPTTAVADLFAARGAWGQGAPAKTVEAPLAAGAVSPLPADATGLAKGFEGQPTVHPLQATPAAQLTPVPESQLADAMKKLLAEREGGGKTTESQPAPVAQPAEAAVAKSAEAADCEAKLRKAAASGIIRFGSDSAVIDAKSNATLDKLAKAAKGCSKGRIRVEGHTDSSGKADHNKQLSERRAQAVADYLVKSGVAQYRIEATGFGAEKPVAPNSTPAGREKNRRIEFTVVD